jgi:hypothetical protein
MAISYHTRLSGFISKTMYELQSPKGFNMNKTKTANHSNPGGVEYVHKAK